MLAFLSSTEMAPFTGAFLLLLGLIALEIVSLLLGGSLMGLDADGPDLDTDFDADFDFDGAEALDAEGALEAAQASTGAAGAGGPLGWFGLREAPFVLWLAGVAAAFGLAGYSLQLAASNVLGAMVPAALAAVVAAPVGLIGGRLFARTVARLAPKTETSAVSRRRLAGRRGVITVGVATRGRPAECRVADLYGNPHRIRVEPQADDGALAAGQDVVVLRRQGPIFIATSIDD
ncbi:MAG: OB-fold-containig protein [Pseudomonadota bacterium]